MALTVKQLLDDVARELQDKGNVRWTRADLLDFFNAAQRALAEYRPDQLAQDRELVLAAGWRQELPADVLTLIDITNNANTAQRRITKTALWTLDAVAGAWRSQTPALEVQHFMLFRAWSVDGEFAGNQALAAAHLELFQGALGVQVKPSNEVAPTM